MKTSHFFYFLLAIILSSCSFGQGNNESEDYGYGAEYSDEYYSENQNSDFAQDRGNQQNTNNMQNTNYQTSNNRSSKGGGIKMYQIMNKQSGMSLGAMPIPSSWERSNNTKENVYFEGPGDVKVYNEVSNSFAYHNDPQRNQFMQQNGAQIKPVKSLERLINEDFKPLLQQQGLRFVSQSPLPQLAQVDKRNDSYLFKATPENKQYQAMVTEWQDQSGKKSMIIIRYFITQYTAIGGLDWGYTCNGMDASDGAYDQAKNAVINALVNYQMNPQWVQANNQHYAQLAQQQNAGHQSRMAQIKSFGDANTARHNQRMAASDARHNSWMAGQASSDAQHSAWMSGQASSDAGQAAIVDGIWEQRNMTDNNGNTYKIEGYDNNVWMNQNNEYISNDNTNWNPNIDNTTNNDTWNQLQSTDDGNW